MSIRHNLLAACAAVALGEYAASCAPTFAEAWPAFALLAFVVATFGFAFAVRGWPFLAIACAAAALFFAATLARERAFRDTPWMRDARPKRASLAEGAGPRMRAVRRDFSRRAALGLSHDRELVQLNRAILLGERATLSPRLKRTFVESGTIHVFAISGLHVMAVARVLMFLFQLLLVPRRFTGLATIPVLWGYVALIGSPPSAVRAAAMATLVFLAPLFYRRADGTVAWSLTFLAVYLGRPTMITNVGCALSFAVMLAIIVSCEVARDRPEGILKGLFVAGAAWAAGVPIAAHVFGRVTPGGLLANLALIPAAGVTVYAGTVGLLASFVSEPLAAHLNGLSGLFTRAMVVLSDVVSRLPGANFEVIRWSIPLCAEWYAVLALLLFLRFLVRRRRRVV